MNIYQAIGDIMKEGYAISKDKRNTQQGFAYRGIDDVMNTFQPLMAARGVFAVPEVLEAAREERQTKQGNNLIYSVLKVKYTFYAGDGSNISAVVIGEGMDSGDKASNKAMAVAMKYAMFQVFCIPTDQQEMPDPDADTPPESRPLKELPKAPVPAKAPAPAPAPAPEPAPVPRFQCECCGAELLPYKDGNGKTVSLRAHAERSRAKFGRVLCLNCIQAQN